MTNSPKRINFLDNYRFMAIVMVVGYHEISYVGLSAAQSEVLTFITRTIAVPVFFLVDGFLFCKKHKRLPRLNYTGVIITNIRRLVVPWLIFSLIYLALRYCFEIIGFLEYNIVVGADPQNVILRIYTSTIAPQMYFLLSLFLIRLLYPLTQKFAGFNGVAILLLFALYTLFFRIFDLKGFFFQGQDPVLNALWGFQYYLFGMLAFKYYRKVSTFAWPIVLFMILLTLFFRVYASSWAVIYQYSFLIGTFFIFYKTGNSERISQFGRLTMGIYLLHTPVLMKALQVLCANLDLNGLFAYFLILIINVALCILVSKVIIKIPYLRWILGESAAGQSKNLLTLSGMRLTKKVT